MSYCGACGCFYWEGCPRRPDGVCSPAPNPHEQRGIELFALAVATLGHVMGMDAQSSYRVAMGQGIAYGDEAFSAAVEPLIAKLGDGE